MKKIIIIVLVMFSVTLTAQKKEKIKGNKEVVEVFKNLDSFTELEIMDGLEVNLMQTNVEGSRLVSDSNLSDIVKFDVVEGRLKIYTTSNIVSSKKLEIYLTFATLTKITLGEKTKLIGQNNFTFDAFEILSYDDSKYELEIKANNLIVLMNGSSKGELNLKSEETSFTLNDNANLKGDIATTNLNLTINKRADLSIKGSTDNFNIIATGSAGTDAKKFKSTKASVNASSSTSTYVYASKYINIYAKDRSDVYVYGSPEIKVDALNDKAKIIKK